MLASIRNSFFRTQAVRPVVTARFLSTPTASQVDDPVQTKFFLGELTNLVESVPDAVPPPDNSKKWKSFNTGRVIKPSDLTPSKCVNERKYTRRNVVPPSAPQARYNDIFRQLNLDPVDFALNPSVLSAYISEMGKIYGRNITGLTSRSQRRLGKAIRRARMIGILPQLSRPSKQWVYTPYRRPRQNSSS